MTFDLGLPEIMLNGGGWPPGTSLVLLAGVASALRLRLTSTLSGAGFGCSSSAVCCWNFEALETALCFRAGAGRAIDVASVNARLFDRTLGTLLASDVDDRE